MDELLQSLLSELRRGTTILCVLSLLRQPMYGYDMVTRLAEGGVAVEAGTLYPLLRRLETQGVLESIWDTDSAKPRKYYVVTATGAALYEALKSHWQNMSASISTLIRGNNNE